MLVEVTEEDIQKGKRGGVDSCPVARAIRRLMPESRVYVQSYVVRLGRGLGRTKTLPLADIVCQFIKAYDFGKPVQPFTFDLPVTS